MDCCKADGPKPKWLRWTLALLVTAALIAAAVFAGARLLAPTHAGSCAGLLRPIG